MSTHKHHQMVAIKMPLYLYGCIPGICHCIMHLCIWYCSIVRIASYTVLLPYIEQLSISKIAQCWQMSSKLTHIIHQKTYYGHQSKVMSNGCWTNSPKVQRILKCFIIPKEMEDTSVSPLVLDKWFLLVKGRMWQEEFTQQWFSLFMRSYSRWCIFHILRGLNL